MDLINNLKLSNFLHNTTLFFSDVEHLYAYISLTIPKKGINYINYNIGFKKYCI